MIVNESSSSSALLKDDWLKEADMKQQQHYGSENKLNHQNSHENTTVMTILSNPSIRYDQQNTPDLKYTYIHLKPISYWHTI